MTHIHHHPKGYVKIDHNIASGHDSACESVYLPNFDLSSFSGENSTFHGISPKQATPIIGAYQSLSIAGGRDNVTEDSALFLRTSV